MIRQRATLFYLAFLLLMLPAVHAQEPDWGTWETMLYDRNQGFVYTLNSANDGDRFQLPAPETAVDSIPRQVAVSRDGTRLAYMTYDTPRGNGIISDDPVDGTLMIYNRETNQSNAYPFRGIIQHALDYPATPAVFDETGQQLALGYLQPDGWYIAVLDLETQSYRQEILSSQTVNLTGVPSTYAQPVPVVTHFGAGYIEFVMVPGETIPTPDVLNSYVWDLARGNVIPTTRTTNLSYDLFLPTGETVEAGRSESYPVNPAFAPHNNVLRVSAPLDLPALAVGGAGTRTTTFYTTRQFDLFRPSFVTDGTQVMFQANDTESGVNWLTLPREGGINFVTTPDEGSRLGIQDVAGTEYGALVVADSDLAAARFGVQQLSGVSVVHIDLRDPFAPVLEPVTSIEAATLDFIWTRYERTGEAPTYLPWEAAQTESEVVSTQAAPATLTVGGQAEVFTTEGDDLNIRSAPGTGFEVVDEVASGDRVRLLEGPVEADGLRWWRVETPNGFVGWTVETADNVVTLLPIGAAETAETDDVVAQPSAPTPTVPVVDTPAPGEIFVGGQAVVQVAGLRLRQEPSTQTTVLAEYQTGTVVNVVGGPVEAEDFTWWQVQAVDSTITGWMVESLGNDTALATAP